ncbi:hypothetical protein QR680_010239 [Steinernema hermaphroditum]|uniref:ShKT domain-containing protein n=1 Tax=Steinernema hermaphroditum TaxID=289476 RepID=A0AA39IQR1_9BILA|nr:hypothetical protein QR680_010239 [Steinernema hermaphroditum]
MFHRVLLLVLLLAVVTTNAQLPCVLGECPPGQVCNKATDTCEAGTGTGAGPTDTCKDNLPWCDRNKGRCNGQFKDFLKQQCAKTCGFC